MGKFTNNEWEAIKEGLSFVNLSPDTFNGSIPAPGITIRFQITNKKAVLIYILIL